MPRLIALDWGSSQLRAWLLGDGGAVLAARSSADGASTLSGGAPAFDAALQSLAGDWLVQDLPVLACGMVGSAHGWREARYVACPADLLALQQHLVKVDTRSGATLHIVPGLIDDPGDEPAGGTPDVMRGEETQLVGLLALQPALADRACVLMPGTHSKWVDVQQGRIAGFRTRMTGELYAVLRQHSVLGRLMPAADGGECAEAFEAGVAAARRGLGADLSGQLFAVRTLGLTGRWPAAALPDYLSGLLIGHELLAGLQPDGAPLALVGDAGLCRRYEHALRLFDIEPAAVLGNTAIAGLWQLAVQAQLCT
ncbi:2-dehydro-3-deoxygalactonokinase [Aquabacterium sp.]|uniref:2-dehydro-3-deoxygalactonokinase n=1 Tax=Aquabacterium sp. TaxID=1872578 RepID=UPI002BC73A90|nr:2-dehydro-3-deoxygalactonokinase [Aquabacterium sp.]HSW04391.1 2-dehydro-3-deoxygalactonokinase [Aquabacterium sp.]